MVDDPVDVVDVVTDADWWLSDVMPAVVRIIIIIAVALVLRWLVLRAVDRTVDRMAQLNTRVDISDAGAVIAAERRSLRSRTLGALFHNVINIVVFVTMGMLLLAELGFNLGPLIAGAGIAGVALGFGAQSLVADFISGIFILIEDQYGVGDIVNLGEATGAVEEVQLRVTKVRAVDGSLWFVRNGEILRVGNMSKGWSRTVLDVSVAYGTDIAQAKEVLQVVGEDFARDPEWADKVLEPPEVWGVEQLGPDGVVIRLVVKTRPGQHFGANRALRERAKESLEAAGIEIPFPQRVMWMRQGKGDAAAAGPAADAGADPTGTS